MTFPSREISVNKVSVEDSLIDKRIGVKLGVGKIMLIEQMLPTFWTNATDWFQFSVLFYCLTQTLFKCVWPFCGVGV